MNAQKKKINYSPQPLFKSLSSFVMFFFLKLFSETVNLKNLRATTLYVSKLLTRETVEIYENNSATNIKQAAESEL